MDTSPFPASYLQKIKMRASLIYNVVHHHISKIHNSVAGTVHKLVGIQAPYILQRSIVTKTVPKQTPRRFTCVEDAMLCFMTVVGSAKSSLRKILISGEYDEFPCDVTMHCATRLAEMLDRYSENLQRTCNADAGLFLVEEVKLLEDARGISLPNVIPIRTVFLAFLQRRVRAIKPTPSTFVDGVWDYLEGVVVRVMMHHCEYYPQMHLVMRKAAERVVSTMRKRGVDRMREMLEMEEVADYTCDPEYTSDWTKLMYYQKELVSVVQEGECVSKGLKIDGFGEVKVGHLMDYGRREVQIKEAFDIKMRLAAYWKVVVRRVVDSVALHLLFSVRSLVDEEMEAAVAEEMMRRGEGGIEWLLEG